MGSNLRVIADCKQMKENQESYPRIKHLLEACPFMCKHRDSYENSVWVNDRSMLHYLLFNDFNVIFRKRECVISMMAVYHEYEFQNDLKAGKFAHFKVSFWSDYFRKLFELSKNIKYHNHHKKTFKIILFICDNKVITQRTN
jgi:hypothetical protein